MPSFKDETPKTFQRYVVNFKKREAEYPMRIEVTIVAPRREAVKKATELLQPIKGLIYDGVS